MYENLYEPLPSVTEYLHRINIYDTPAVNKVCLDKLIYSHQCTVPFENLDVSRYKKEIKLGVSDLYEKVIVNKRGGYCFELNSLFFALLKALGFKGYACLVKVCGEGRENPPALHRGTIITLEDGQYYCDVGFGGPVPAGAMKFEEQTLQEIQGEKYRFIKLSDNWWELSRISGSGDEVSLLRINTNPYEQEDFVALSHYCSCHTIKDGLFTNNIMANIRVEGQGHYSLMNDVLTRKIDGDSTDIKLESEQEIIKILEKHFHLTVKNL